MFTRYLIDLIDRGDRVVDTRVVYSANYATAVDAAIRYITKGYYPEAVDYHIYTEDL